MISRIKGHKRYASITLNRYSAYQYYSKSVQKDYTRTYRWFRAMLSYLRKSEGKKKRIYCFPLKLRIKSPLQMCCNSTVSFKIRVIKFNFCCNTMISKYLPNFKTQLSQKEEVGSYDNIALNQRIMILALSKDGSTT